MKKIIAGRHINNNILLLYTCFQNCPFPGLVWATVIDWLAFFFTFALLLFSFLKSSGFLTQAPFAFFETAFKPFQKKKWFYRTVLLFYSAKLSHFPEILLNSDLLEVYSFLLVHRFPFTSYKWIFFLTCIQEIPT